MEGVEVIGFFNEEAGIGLRCSCATAIRVLACGWVR
jgi:hypothetical protein